MPQETQTASVLIGGHIHWTQLSTWCKGCTGVMSQGPGNASETQTASVLIGGHIHWAQSLNFLHGTGVMSETTQGPGNASETQDCISFSSYRRSHSLFTERNLNVLHASSSKRLLQYENSHVCRVYGLPKSAHYQRGSIFHSLVDKIKPGSGKQVPNSERRALTVYIHQTQLSCLQSVWFAQKCTIPKRFHISFPSG